jgi:hypothetical protein
MAGVRRTRWLLNLKEKFPLGGLKTPYIGVEGIGKHQI